MCAREEFKSLRVEKKTDPVYFVSTGVSKIVLSSKKDMYESSGEPDH